MNNDYDAGIDVYFDYRNTINVSRKIDTPKGGKRIHHPIHFKEALIYYVYNDHGQEGEEMRIGSNHSHSANIDGNSVSNIDLRNSVDSIFCGNYNKELRAKDNQDTAYPVHDQTKSNAEVAT